MSIYNVCFFTFCKTADLISIMCCIKANIPCYVSSLDWYIFLNQFQHLCYSCRQYCHNSLSTLMIKVTEKRLSISVVLRLKYSMLPLNLPFNSSNSIPKFIFVFVPGNIFISFLENLMITHYCCY